MKLTKLARGMPCLIRIPDYCNFDLETTVGCHYRLSGLNGMGMKPDDLFVAWGCSSCHDVVDGRRNSHWGQALIRQWHAEGVFRTQAKLLELGVIHCGKRLKCL